MNIQYGLSSAIIGTVALVSFHAQAAMALSPDEVAKVAKQVTVQIKRVNNSGFGSGVIIKQSGQTYTVLTAAHVITGSDQYSVYTSDGQKYGVNAGSIKPLTGADLAVVQFTSSQRYEIAKIGNSAAVPLQSPAYVSGFPATSSAGTETTYRLSPGVIAAQASRPRADGYALAYFNDTFGGMSGGPVFNSAGEVIGIHGRSESEFRESKGVDLRTGNKLGLNLAIPINLFLDLSAKQLPELGLASKTKSKPSQAQTADDFLLQGVEKHTRGNRQGAISDYNEAIKLNPKLAAAYITRGYAKTQEKDFTGSVADYNQGLSANLNFADAYNGRGNAKGELGDTKGAIADYDQAIQVNPKHSVSYANRAIARLTLKDTKGAITDCEQAIALTPNHATVHSICGAAYAASGDKKKSLAYFDEAIRINPNDPDIYSTRGLTYYKLGKKKEAISDFDQAIRLDPNNYSVYSNRATIRFYFRDYQGGMTDLDQAIRLSPKQSLLYMQRGSRRLDLNDAVGAIKDFDQAIQLNSNNPMGYALRGLARGKLSMKQGISSKKSKEGLLSDLKKFKEGILPDFKKSNDLFVAKGTSITEEEKQMQKQIVQLIETFEGIK